MRELIAAPAFKKDLRKLPEVVLARLDALTKQLQINPLDPRLGTKKLTGYSSSLWRIRIGNYRIVYRFDRVKVELVRIGHRKDIYRL